MTAHSFPTTIRVYRAISPKSLAALREPLARQVFRVSKYDEEHGRRSFHVQADGSWVYDNTVWRMAIPLGTNTDVYTPLLVHEAGHNLSKNFFHTPDGKGLYEYHQEGLQSNDPSKIHPTMDNTIEIINDETNRQNIN